MPSKKMGRPPLPKGESKAGLIGVRLKPDEAAELTQAAGSKGLSPSEEARSRIVPPSPIAVRSKWKASELNGERIHFRVRWPTRTLEGIGEIKALQRPSGEISVTIVRNVNWDAYGGERIFIFLPQTKVDKIELNPDPLTGKFILWEEDKIIGS